MRAVRVTRWRCDFCEADFAGWFEANEHERACVVAHVRERDLMRAATLAKCGTKEEEERDG